MLARRMGYSEPIFVKLCFVYWLGVIRHFQKNLLDAECYEIVMNIMFSKRLASSFFTSVSYLRGHVK